MKKENIPPTFADKDPYLKPFEDVLLQRCEHIRYVEDRLTGGQTVLENFALAHSWYGLHRSNQGWVFREWAPNATSVHLIGDFSNWQPRDEFSLRRLNDNGDWELNLAGDAIRHGELFKLHVSWAGGSGERIPAYARRVVQDEATKIFSAQVWQPEQPYQWKHIAPNTRSRMPQIYESHVGMALEDGRVGAYAEFRLHILPRIKQAGYNTLQLMAVQEHPYYGSFGYHVANFFAVSSRCGTPDEFKELVDAAHGMGIAVIMDLVHSHAVSNALEGLAEFDGTQYQYFHDGARGRHEAWDSRCFDYGKPQVMHFLLSNCRFWLEEYHLDGFRFDGITSMLYLHHGLGTAFGSYEAYFGGDVDHDALAYIALANKLIHRINPQAITIAEDVSGMPGLCAPLAECGYGFDYRLAMGMPDAWFKMVREQRDEEWNMHHVWHVITDHRPEERTISYVESHDQAIVGDKTMIFELLDAAMYYNMDKHSEDVIVDRGIALHKLLRLVTIAASNGGYLNFMGNEFGHPEWIDFPREGNGWSHHYARRQWSLRDNPDLRYHFLADFDAAMLRLFEEYCSGDNSEPKLICAHDGDKVLAFMRGKVLFVFNFNPLESFSDYGICVAAGSYRLLLDSDEACFGGYARLKPAQKYVTQPLDDEDDRHMLKLYLPNRTALVLLREA